MGANEFINISRPHKIANLQWQCSQYAVIAESQKRKIKRKRKQNIHYWVFNCGSLNIIQPKSSLHEKNPERINIPPHF